MGYAAWRRVLPWLCSFDLSRARDCAARLALDPCRPMSSRPCRPPCLRPSINTSSHHHCAPHLHDLTSASSLRITALRSLLLRIVYAAIHTKDKGQARRQHVVVCSRSNTSLHGHLGPSPNHLVALILISYPSYISAITPQRCSLINDAADSVVADPSAKVQVRLACPAI